MQRSILIFFVASILSLAAACSSDEAKSGLVASADDDLSETGQLPGSGSAAALRVSAAVDNVNLEPYRFSWNITLGGLEGFDGEVSLGVIGQVDPAGEQISISIDFSSLFEAISTLPTEDEMDAEILSMFSGDEPVQMVISEGAAYLRWSAFTELFGVTTPWVLIPMDDVQTGFGEFADPSAFLEVLGEVLDLTEVGRETIDGDQVTHYTGVLDPMAAAALADPAAVAGVVVDGSIPTIDDVPMDIWIDDSDRLRRFSVFVDAADFDEGLGSFSAVFNFGDFGEPVTISAPAPDEVTDMTDVTAGISELSESY
ncbi:MAG TPA: hypothetical protein QGF35_01895 [Dehalococcoidia bacterium]|nr:hypothetical protein [Dehalococcoidia bacterium]